MEDTVDGGGGGAPLPAEIGERTATKGLASLAADGKPLVPSRPVPTRPAPPPPGAARHSPIIPRSQPSTAAVRTEQMSAPAKPSGPPTQVTTKKQDPSEQSPLPHKGAGKMKSQSSVKKRLEITIVDARPMSQVGFRSVMPQPTLTTDKPTIPVTQANHHNVKPALDSQAESSQPTILRPSRPKSIVGITEAAGDNTESQVPPPLPKRSPIVSALHNPAHLPETQPPPKPARAADAIRKPQEEKPSEGVAQVDKPVHPIKPTRVSIIRPAPRQKPPAAEVESSISEASPNIVDREEPLEKAQTQASQGPPRPRPPPIPSRPTASSPQDQISLSEEVIESDGVLCLSSPSAVPAIRPQGVTNKVTSERLDGQIFSQANGLNASATSAASRAHPPPVPASRPHAPPTAVTGQPQECVAAPKPVNLILNAPRPPPVPASPLKKLPVSSGGQDASAPVPLSRGILSQPPNRPLPIIPSRSGNTNTEVNQHHLYECVESVHASPQSQGESAKLNEDEISNFKHDEKFMVPSKSVTMTDGNEQNIEELYAKINKPGKSKRQDTSEQSSGHSDDQTSPHPFGVKLRKTISDAADHIEDEVSNQQDVVTDSQEGDTFITQTRNPPTAAKPKPLLSPKPRALSMPSLPNSESVFLSAHENSDVQGKPQAESSDECKQLLPKRPTILRPSKPITKQDSKKYVDKSDPEEANSVQVREKSDSTSLRPQSLIDAAPNAVDKSAAAMPSLPSRRPVTVIGFPHHKSRSPDLGLDSEGKKVSPPTPKQRRTTSQSSAPNAANKDSSSCDDGAQSTDIPLVFKTRDVTPAATLKAPPPRPDTKPRNSCSEEQKIPDSKFSEQPPPHPGNAPLCDTENLTNICISSKPHLDAETQRSQSPTSTFSKIQEAQENSPPSSPTSIPDKLSLPLLNPANPSLATSPSSSPPSSHAHSSDHSSVLPSPRAASTIKKSGHAEKEATKAMLTSQPARLSCPPSRPQSTPAVRTAIVQPVTKPDVQSGSPPRPQPARPPPLKDIRHTELPSLPKRPGISHPLYRYMIGEPHAIALHDFSATQRDELTFQEGDIIVLLKRIDDQWLKGKVGDAEGIFPQNFVHSIHPLYEELPSSAINDMMDETFDEASADKPDNLTGPRCRARFDFEGEGHSDLAFEAGDIIQLLAHCGSDWLKGQLKEKTGIFPASFVEIIEDLPKDMENTAAETRNRETTALFDFEGEHGELSFQAGDKIHVISKVNDQWLYGACSGKEGSFPASFVDEIPHDLPQHGAATSTVDSATNDVAAADYKDMTVCIAVYDYQSEHEGDLAFKQGDSIEILDSAGTTWLRGRLHGIEGIFPASFVSFQSDPADHMHAVEPGTGLESHSALVLGRALHDFVGETDIELTFQVGDEVILGAMFSEDSEWQWGELNGRRGIFPASFVEML